MQKIKNSYVTEIEPWFEKIKKTKLILLQQKSIKYKANSDHQIIKVCNYTYESLSYVT